MSKQIEQFKYVESEERGNIIGSLVVRECIAKVDLYVK